MPPSRTNTDRINSYRRSLTNLLRQMLLILASRTVPTLSFLPDQQRHWDHVQRCHIECLIDYNVNVFRSRIQSVIPSSRALSIGALPRPLTWGHQGADSNLLYFGARPLTVFMPGVVRDLSLLELDLALHDFKLELSPLALPDVVGLHHLATLARPYTPRETLSVAISCLLTDEDDIGLTDEVTGNDICWFDVFHDDYILAELQITRIFTSDDTWFIRYRLLAATRLATSN